MSAAKNKPNTKALQRSKQRRRRTLTFVRMCRYGVNNFSRNAWLTIAATAVMSITLLIVFMTVSARQVLLDTLTGISQSVDVSLYLKGATDEKAIDDIKSRLERVEGVTGVRYISAEQSRKEQADQNRDDPDTLAAIKEASNEMPATLRVSLEDLNNRTALDEFIANDKQYQANKSPKEYKSTEDTKSESSGGKRDVIDTIGSWVRLATIGGSVAAVVFVVISSLVVFNTIRMAIFNRKDEIQMMKLIGAERSFIRGPFIVEAIMYGFIAAVVASAMGYGLILWASDPLVRYGIPMNHLLEILMQYIGFVILGMITVGALIGVISSWIATRKYLKL